MTSRTNHIAAAFLLISILGMSAAHAGGQVKGWWTAGSAPQDYDFGTEHVSGGQGQKSAFIKCIAADPKGFGTLSQAISATQYRGKRVRLSAMMKAKDAESAQLWLRMDGSDQKVLNFYNMNDKPVKGTTEWKRYEIVLDVPQESLAIFYGYFVQGKGEAWADSFKIETVGNDVPVSKFTGAGYSDKPVNAGFEE